MGEVTLASSSIIWGRNGFIEAVGAISDIGYHGLECSSHLVREYEDRLHVFEEILDIANLKLAAMMQYADLLNTENADETVERVANTARFLGAIGSPAVVVSPTNQLEEPLSKDEWTTMAAILEEMGMRCREFNIDLAFRPRTGFIAGNNRDIKHLMGMCSPDMVKLCLDSAELTLAGINLERFFKTWEKNIIYIRFRDVSGAKRRKAVTSEIRGSAPQFGRGAVNFTKLGNLIHRSDYTGWITVEVAGESNPPKSAAETAYRFLMRKSSLFL
ncbi:MAG: TIM barrel protein [Planctomycetes bacterium]|nr:TIM barrel protein [Planctomycetota bacterium]